MSADQICRNCEHPRSAHTHSEMGCAWRELDLNASGGSRGCPCAEYQRPVTPEDDDFVPVNHALLEDIQAVLEKDWKNAALTRQVNALLHPVPPELTLREKVMAAMNAAETWGAACDAAIATIFDAVVRLPHPHPDTTVLSESRAFMAGAERVHLAILNLLKPEREL